MMTRDEAREKWAASGVSVKDLKADDFSQLRVRIDEELSGSGLIAGYRATRTPRIVNARDGDGRTVEIFCRSRYFDKREAVTFNRNGFIGFAGWADDMNVQPILTAFCGWVEALMEARLEQEGPQP